MRSSRSSPFLILALTLLIAGVGVAQSTSPSATPTPDTRTLDQAHRDNEAAQADYYRAQTQKLSTPDRPKSFWQRLSENAAILGALTAALVAVFSLIFNQRAALRARKDTEFYEALKRFGDKDSPTVRASAVAILLEMAKTGFFAWRWRKIAPWWRPDLKMRRYPYFDTVFDQLIGGLMLEDNHVVSHRILRALEQLMPRNFGLAARQLRELNMKLQGDVATSLTQFLVAKGLTSPNHNERQPYIKHAHTLIDCSERALEYMYDKFPGGKQSFESALKTYTATNYTEKKAQLLAAQKRLTNLRVQLRVNVNLCCTLLSIRPEHGMDLDFNDMYLEKARLAGANLQRVLFRGAMLKQADFYLARLEGASFELADLTDAWFYRSVLTNTNFGGATFSKFCNFNGANWWQADFTGPLADVVLPMLIETLDDKKITPQMIQEAHPSVREYLQPKMKAETT